MKRLRITIGAFIAVMLLSGAVMVSFLYLRSQQISNVQIFNEELKAGLVLSCEKNGNPLRETVQGLLREQIKSSENKKFLREFFPQIPPSKLEALIHVQVAADRARLRQIAPLDCATLYK